MKFSQIFLVVVTAIAVAAVLNFFHQRKIDSIEDRLRQQAIQQIEDLQKKHSEELGEYYTQVSRISSSLTEERSLTKELRQIINTLEKDLHAKALRIQILEVAIDTLESQGTAIVYVDSVGTRTYTISEKKQGSKVDMVLEHPSGNYDLSIAYDPISIEILAARTHRHEIQINSVRFPGSPHLKLSSFEVVEVLDSRNWLQKIWDNTTAEIGVFTGESQGISASVGYKNVLVGPVFTEKGTNIGVWYRLK